MKEVRQLPFNQESEKKWSFFYAYNLKILRDIFVYVSINQISRKQLYAAMDAGIIEPPKDKWVGNKVDDPHRLKLEYLHGAKYLNLIVEESDELKPEPNLFLSEKNLILNENINRSFGNGEQSPDFTSTEIDALTPIILNYSRAKEYLWWFLDFEKEFISLDAFKLEDVRSLGKPFYLKKETGKKASDIVYRTTDLKYWKVPFDEKVENDKVLRSNDYSRPVSFVFPAWFDYLDIVNKIPVLSEFDFLDGNWDLHYPISDISLSLQEFEEFILKKFNSYKKKVNVVFIPLIIYQTALEFRISIEQIKDHIIRLYETGRPKYVMERSSFQVNKYSKHLRTKTSYNELFIMYRDFPRTNLIIHN